MSWSEIKWTSIVLAIIFISHAQGAPASPTLNLPPTSIFYPLPAAPPSIAVCDVIAGPAFVDQTACGLSSWVGPAAVLTPGLFSGTLFINLDSTKLTSLDIVTSTLAVTLCSQYPTISSCPDSGVVPAFIVVGTGLCFDLASATACLSSVNASGAFNPQQCYPGCLPESLQVVSLPYAYYSSISLNSTGGKNISLVRNLSTLAWTTPANPSWSLAASSGQLYLFAGSLSNFGVQLDLTASSQLTWRSANPFPPSYPAHGTLRQLPSALLAVLLAAVLVAGFLDTGRYL